MFEVKDSDLRKRQLILYSKRESELLEIRVRRLKDRTNKAISNGDSKRILN